MTNDKAVYRTQADAIREAKKLAREAAENNGADWTESVLLWSGDTLHLTSSPNGKITERVESGWVLDGLVHCSRRVSEVAQ